MERTYTNEQLVNIDPPPFEFEGRTYTIYEATQKQRQIERTMRKLKREKVAFEAAGLEEDAQATNIQMRRLSQKYKEFSKAAGLPEQRERMNVGYSSELKDIKRFAAFEDYQGNISVIGKPSDRQYEVRVDSPIITGVTQHFMDNLTLKPDRAWLTVEEAQDIIKNSILVLYQTDKKTLKFLADNGYTVLSMQGKIVTAVPEKLRKKYRNYLEGK